MKPLKTGQLTSALTRKLGQDFVIVCAVHELELDTNGIYVVNTDTGHGRHWVVLYVIDTTVEFFDSFGRHPQQVQNGHIFMQCIGDKILVVTSKKSTTSM